MTNYYNKLIKAVIVITIFLQFSCKKDFLENPPTTDAVRQEYVNSVNSCSDYINGVYVDLSLYLYHYSTYIYPELIADNIKPATGVTDFAKQYAWSQDAGENISNSTTATNINMNGLWTTCYRIIRNCDYLIENIDRFRSENPAKADDIKGQAYAIRALVHHELLNVFAQPYKFTPDASHTGVPYVSVSDYKQPIVRASVKDCYDLLISDLLQAIQLLPSNPTTMVQTNWTLVINRNAAKALLARIYLFKGDYASAKNLARDVIASVPLMKTNYPSKLFTLQETEALFQMPPVSTSYSTFFASRSFRLTKQYIPTQDMISMLLERPNDSRKSWVTNTSGTWLITKYPVGVVAAYTVPEGSYYQTVLRSSEMYLTAAESYAKIGNEDSAKYFLDAIRQRADPTAPISLSTGTALLDSLYKERRKELCFESLRMYDLLRLGKNVNRTDPSNSSAMTLPYPSTKSIAPIHGLDVRYYGLEQNPSY